MKKNILKIFVLSFVLIIGLGTGLSAQNFYSKPEAIKNLSDSAKQLASTLPALLENDANKYKINTEKIRFIKSMLTGIKQGATVAEAASTILPKEEFNVIQPAVRFIDVSFSNKTPNQYIRSEIMFLISY
ncbi:MAG: hypothetical protein ACJA1A_000834 [Saprospiraceae bacterium]|jgi:hypothetical protein